MPTPHLRRRVNLRTGKWRELVGRFDASGDTVEACCNREGVIKSSFQRWCGRVADGDATAASAAQQPTQAGFVALGMMKLPAASGARLKLTLDLGGGVTLRVARG